MREKKRAGALPAPFMLERCLQAAGFSRPLQADRVWLLLF
jgi:hypothetical protein